MSYGARFCMIITSLLVVLALGGPTNPVAASTCAPFIDHIEVTQSVQQGLGPDPAVEEALGGRHAFANARRRPHR